MASYHQENISLIEAMTMNLPYRTRVWHTPGLNIENTFLTKNANVKSTFVMLPSNGSTVVGVEYTIEGDPATYINTTKQFPQLELEKLQKEFPKLFVLKGQLQAF